MESHSLLKLNVLTSPFYSGSRLKVVNCVVVNNPSALMVLCGGLSPKPQHFWTQRPPIEGSTAHLAWRWAQPQTPGWNVMLDASNQSPLTPWPHSSPGHGSCVQQLSQIDVLTRMERSWRTVTSRTGPFPFFFSKNFGKKNPLQFHLSDFGRLESIGC